MKNLTNAASYEADCCCCERDCDCDCDCDCERREAVGLPENASRLGTFVFAQATLIRSAALFQEDRGDAMIAERAVSIQDLAAKYEAHLATRGVLAPSAERDRSMRQYLRADFERLFAADFPEPTADAED